MVLPSPSAWTFPRTSLSPSTTSTAQQFLQTPSNRMYVTLASIQVMPCDLILCRHHMYFKQNLAKGKPIALEQQTLSYGFLLSSFLGFVRNRQLTQVAGAKRGPSRFLGKTRSQILDSFMRSNARICALITATFFPICAYWTWRYNYIIKPKREELKKVAEQELLAEGKYVAEKQ